MKSNRVHRPVATGFRIEEYRDRRQVVVGYEIRYFTLQGERMSADTFPTAELARAHADAVMSGKQKLRAFCIGL